MQKYALVAFAAATFVAGSAYAQRGTTFIEAGPGASITHASEIEFINPLGGGYIKSFSPPPVGASQVVGDDIILNRQRRDATSPTGEFTIGHFVGDSIFARATARYLGSYHFSGTAGFPIDATGSVSFDQDYYLRGYGVYAGVGYEKRFGSGVFVDVSLEAGAASLRSFSLQGANLGDPLGHPRHTRTNFSGGGEIGLGVRLNDRLDLIVKARGDWLGTAQTGISEAMISPDGNFGLNPDEQLKVHDLISYGVGISLRARF